MHGNLSQMEDNVVITMSSFADGLLLGRNDDQKANNNNTNNNIYL